MPSPDLPSSALLAANARLAELRAVHRQQAGGSSRGVVREDEKLSDLAPVTAVQPQPLPAHLGWGSTAVSNHLRQAEASRQKAQRKIAAQAWGGRKSVSHSHSQQHPLTPKPNKGKQPSRPSSIKLYPDIGLGMLRREQAAPGRIWLLLRHSDVFGRGWVDVAQARAILTGKESSLRTCGWRQLRNLLKQGEGVFWQRDKERIWLRSAAKVAYALGVTQLTGRPVGLPVSALVGGIGNVRAHLYASFHSGRVKVRGQISPAMPGVWSPPIARDTLTAVSGVGRVSQRTYEARTKTKVQRNFAVGETVAEVNRERRAWQQGQALFELKDYRGEQGRKGRTYLAWQLPNTYIGRHQQRPQGRQKRINRELKDLVMKGMPGTVEETSETSELALMKRYYPNGRLAAQAYSRKLNHELYWQRHRTENDRLDIWQGVNAAQE